MTSLAEVAERILRLKGRTTPFVVGVTGSVAAGKSTFASALRESLTASSDALAVELVCTDGFLFDNAMLESRGLTLKKGFPESYDGAALARTLAAVREGPAEFPGYSHVTYDVDAGLALRIERPDVLIVEGLGLHDPAAAGLDALIYLDAEEVHLETWFTERFMGLWRAAEHDPGSFYAAFRRMSPEEARGFAGQVWRGINLPNLREHILPARDVADLVVRKGPDHAIEAIFPGQDASRSSSSAAMSSFE